jgi:hypothetical protein
MGPGRHESVGKSQRVLMMIDPMISPRFLLPPATPCVARPSLLRWLAHCGWDAMRRLWPISESERGPGRPGPPLAAGRSLRAHPALVPDDLTHLAEHSAWLRLGNCARAVDSLRVRPAPPARSPRS